MVLEHSLVIARAFLDSVIFLIRPCHNLSNKFMATANENFCALQLQYISVNIIIIKKYNEGRFNQDLSWGWYDR